MKHRCNYLKDTHYKDYGGRGIKFCEEWNDFLSFYLWAYSNGYKDNLTLDRIDNNGNYEPVNCRWVTITEQNRPGGKRPKSDILFIDFRGEHLSSKDWSRKLGGKSNVVLQRIKRGWNPIDAVSTPL
jgi:hypothetical protein